MVALAAWCGVCSLAVDWGRVQLAKTSMQCATDAAARAAAASLSGGTTAARSAAVTVAAYNSVDGQPLVLQSSDVVFGKWNSATQTLDTTSPTPDTVQITGRRTAARGNAIPLTFAKLVGVNSSDLTVTAYASYTVNPPGGIVGLNGIDAKNNFYTASYDSSVTTSPSHSNHNDNGALGSNAVISGSGTLRGDAILGPSGSITGISVTGSSGHRTSPIPTPTAATWSPGTNPGGISQTYSVGGSTTTLPGGTYWFTSLTVTGTLAFSGAATLYVNGNADISGTLTAYNGLPANLKIYQIGAHTFGNAGSDGGDITADIEGPSSDFVVKNNFTFRGRMIFNTITVKNNVDFFYDETFGPVAGSTTISTVR